MTEICLTVPTAYLVDQTRPLEAVFQSPPSGTTDDGGARLLVRPLRSVQRFGSAVLLTGVLVISPGRPNNRPRPTGTIVEEEANQQAPHLIALEWIERAMQLPLERVARLLGITRPTLYAWQQGAQIRSSNQQRLFAVQDVLKRAAVSHPTPELLVAWLDMPRGADGRTPAQLLEAGDMDRARLLAVSTPVPELLRAPAWTHEPVAEAFQGVTEHFAEAQAPDNDAQLANLWNDGDDEDEPVQEIVFGE